MVKGFVEEFGPLVIQEIQQAYLQRKIIKTIDCQDDMRRDGLFEADVEKVIMEATSIVKAMSATSDMATNPKNTHYVIHGESIKCLKIYCKICSNYHPTTDEFICWRLTSFCINKS
jgi:hypothetical protein